jgi:hypothetical protein
MRLIFSLATITLFACGGSTSSPQSEKGVSLGATPAPTTPSTSSNVLGPCTGENTPCANGAGHCAKSLNEGGPQCLALAGANGSCKAGSFSAAYNETKRLCLDLCTTARDCAKGFFCNPTVLTNERNEVVQVSVCMPGAVNRVGMGCSSSTECQFSDVALMCVGASSTQKGVCTKPCSANTECQTGADREPRCARASGTSAMCVRPCTSDFACSGAACVNGACLPQSAMMTGYPTPAFGQIGGACTSQSSCGAGASCLSAPGGMCSKACTTNSECGPNNVCVTSGNSALCMAACATPSGQSTCRAGFQCRALQGVSYGFCLY